MLAFVHIHKTAGTTLNWILRSSFGIRHWDVEPADLSSDYFSRAHYQKLARFTPRIESIAGHKIRAFSDLEVVRPDIKYYTFVREPIARMASLYQHGVQRGGLQQTPEQWLEGRANGQTLRIAGVDDAEAAIEILEKKFFFVGDVKNFDESLLLFKAFSENPKIKVVLQARNVASHNLEKKQLLDNPKLVGMIKALTRNDQIVYDYVKNTLYPKYQKAYGPCLAQDLENLRNERSSASAQIKLMSNFLVRRGIYRPALKLARRRLQ